MPAKAGIQASMFLRCYLDSRLRGNDKGCHSSPSKGRGILACLRKTTYNIIMLSYILFIVGFGLLIKGADLLVDGASSMARQFHVSDLVIGLTVVAFGTSLPELSVSAVASARGKHDTAIGNIIGSNIFNILLNFLRVAWIFFCSRFI